MSEYNNTTDVNFKKELVLNFDKFNKPITLKNLEALAQVIQNLLIIEPGTYPNQPDIGVGIGNYLFEIMDNKTKLELLNNINNQIERFIGYNNADIECDIGVNNNKKTGKINSLLLSFKIESLNANPTLDNFDGYLGFNIIYGINQKSNELVSQIYI